MAISKIDSDGITAGGITADSLDIGQIGGRKNIVYNGATTVWQRGTSADTATTGDYMCDRWAVFHNTLDGNVDWDQETASTPDGFGYALKISTDASETSLDAADYLFIRQRFEGQDLQQLQKGTSGAKSLTLSFWVKSSVASTYTAELEDVDNSRIVGGSYSISSANTWEYKTVTFVGDTTGALDNDNANSLSLNFWIDAGSNFTSGTFSTAWQTASNTERVYDTTGWLESASPEFYITGVQLEVGSVATPFEHRSYGEELALCQRYYQVIASDNGDAFAMGTVWSNSAPYGILNFLPMRSNPTFDQTSGTNYYRLRTDGNTIYVDSFGIADYGNKAALIYTASAQTGGTRGASGWFDVVDANGFIALKAEL